MKKITKILIKEKHTEGISITGNEEEMLFFLKELENKQPHIYDFVSTFIINLPELVKFDFFASFYTIWKSYDHVASNNIPIICEDEVNSLFNKSRDLTTSFFKSISKKQNNSMDFLNDMIQEFKQLEIIIFLVNDFNEKVNKIDDEDMLIGSILSLIILINIALTIEDRIEISV